MVSDVYKLYAVYARHSRLPSLASGIPRHDLSMMTRLVRTAALLLAASLASGSDVDSDVRVGRWTLLRGVEKALQGTAGFVRGVGDTLAVGAGGTIRMLGGVVHDAGGGLEGLGDAVAGDQADDDIGTADALRSVASRPIRVVGRALRAVGDTTNFIGDTTERITAEAVGILPDTVRVVESGVRSLRGKIDGDDADLQYLAQLEAGGAGGGAAGASQLAEGATFTGLKMRRSLEEGMAHPPISSPPTGGSATAADAATDEKTPWLRGRLDRWRSKHELAPSSKLRSHAFIALLAVALGGRSTGGNNLGLGVIILLALLYLGTLVAQAEAEQREAMRRDAAAMEREVMYLNPRLPLVPESTRWLNTLIASGWEATIKPKMIESISEEMKATIEELALPKSLKAIELSELHLGSRPPFIRSLASAVAPGPTVGPTAGCVTQVELEWEAPDASATLTFMLSNVASRPKLRLRRVQLRGTLRLHWEWIEGDPFIGTLRFAFVRPPEVANVALEPLGSIDVTTLPGLGTWIRDALNSALLASACLPNWIETDMRISRDVPTPSPAAVQHESGGEQGEDAPTTVTSFETK